MDEIALGAVDAAEGFRDVRAADLPAFRSQLVAQGLRQGGDLIQMRGALSVQGFRELFGAVGFFAEAGQHFF